MTESELAAQYQVDVRTVRRWKAAGEPIDDFPAMQRRKNLMRSRAGVSKMQSKKQADAPRTAAPVKVVAVTTEPLTLLNSVAPDDALTRTTVAERTAFERYQQTGDPRDAVAYASLSGERRRLEE
jgi:hypothetical protein